MQSNDVEIAAVSAEGQELEVSLKSVEVEMSEILRPQVRELVEKSRSLDARQAELMRQLELLRRAKEISGMLEGAMAPAATAKPSGENRVVSSVETDGLVAHVQSLLDDWNFPTQGDVRFSEQDQDVIVARQGRGTHGKGVRAIIRASFNLGLMQFCVDQRRPFPGFVLVDSPLVVYREPDPSERNFPLHVKELFYERVADRFADQQVIVLENDRPPAGLEKSANVIRFSGSATGRWGFLPHR